MKSPKTFKQHYDALDTEQRKLLRIKAQIECGITERTFFNWLRCAPAPRPPHQKVIARLLGRKAVDFKPQNNN